MSPSTWSLHSQLTKDTIDIGDLPLSRVLVIKDANYPWLLLVPRRPEINEIIDLDEVEQAQLTTEVSRAAPATPPGRVRSGARCRRFPMTPRKYNISSARYAAKSGWVERGKCLHSNPFRWDSPASSTTSSIARRICVTMTRN